MPDNNKNLQLLDDFINLRGEGRELYKSIFKYIRDYLRGCFEDAEDVIIETQLNAWKNRNKYDSSKRLEPWLYTIATNACRDYQRKRKSRIKLVTNLPDSYDEPKQNYDVEDKNTNPSLSLELEETSVQFRKIVKRLPEKLREPIILVYYQGLKYREAAEKLRISIGTVKTRLRRGILRLGLEESLRKDEIAA